MSTSLLIVGAIAVFLAVFAVAYAVQSIVAERRQAYRTIQAIRALLSSSAARHGQKATVEIVE